MAGPVEKRAADLLSQPERLASAADVQPELVRVRVRGHVCLSLLMLGQRPRDRLESIDLTVSQSALPGGYDGLREIE